MQSSLVPAQIYNSVHVSYFLIYLFFFLQMAEGGRIKVWDYFTKDPSGTLICNICAGSVSQRSNSLKLKNTTN